MNEPFLEILKKIRLAVREKSLDDYSLSAISLKTGISEKELLQYVKNEEELVEKILEMERQKFEEIFTEHDFEGVNAIDILLTVSKEVARKFAMVSPSLSFNVKEKHPSVYHDHFNKRIGFIFNKIQINIQKGISQGMYREDLSIELVARLYISRLIDLHNPSFFPPDKFSFKTLFEFMFENFVRSIAKPEGIAYFEKKIKSVKFDVDRSV